ncbi:MAG: hypothetical protein LBF38_08565 [Deltaproteobacteria bacterium]|nr:hypothetical protein [Deltaproteobacteria bacterium]
MKTKTYKLVFLLIPVLAISFLATGCVNEFMFAAQSGMYDPYYGEYYDDGGVYVENNYYPVTSTTTVIRTVPAQTTIVYENERPRIHKTAPNRRKAHANNYDDNGNNRRQYQSKSNSGHVNKRPNRRNSEQTLPVQQTKSVNSGGQKHGTSPGVKSGGQRQRTSQGVNSGGQRQRTSQGLNSGGQTQRPKRSVDSSTPRKKSSQSSSGDEEVIWPRSGGRSRGNQK